MQEACIQPALCLAVDEVSLAAAVRLLETPEAVRLATLLLKWLKLFNGARGCASACVPGAALRMPGCCASSSPSLQPRRGSQA